MSYLYNQRAYKLSTYSAKEEFADAAIYYAIGLISTHMNDFR